MTVRVLIVEGHHLLRKGLCCMISEMPTFDVVGQASNGRDGIFQAVALHPDLVLIDLSLPGMSGFEAISQIKKRLPDVKTVILTEHDDENYVREALRIGANGYVLKDVPFDEFSLALKLIVSGRKYFCNQTSMRMLDLCIQENNTLRTATAWDRLSERERAVMKLVAEGYTNRAAGQYLCISCKTVEKHRASLMRKLALRNAADMVVMAIELGLVERPRQPGRSSTPAPAFCPAPTFPAINLSGIESSSHCSDYRAA
jgi:DNA-binding NarL/FixJ family response regulator